MLHKVGSLKRYKKKLQSNCSHKLKDEKKSKMAFHSKVSVPHSVCSRSKKAL